jgi:hypothetical protein
MLLGGIGNQAGGLAHVGGCVRPYQVSRLLPINRSSLLSLLPLCCGLHPRNRRAARATRRSPRTSPGRVVGAPTSTLRVLEYGYFDKTCGCEFPGRWLHDLAGLRAIVHVRDYGKVPFRVHHAPHPVIQPHLAHDSCGPRSTRWLRKLTPRGSSLSDPAGRTGSIVRTSSATQVCSDDGKRACPRMAGGTSSRLSTSCRGRRRNLRQDSRRR